MSSKTCPGERISGKSQRGRPERSIKPRSGPGSPARALCGITPRLFATRGFPSARDTNIRACGPPWFAGIRSVVISPMRLSSALSCYHAAARSRPGRFRCDSGWSAGRPAALRSPSLRSIRAAHDGCALLGTGGKVSGVGTPRPVDRLCALWAHLSKPPAGGVDHHWRPPRAAARSQQRKAP